MADHAGVPEGWMPAMPDGRAILQTDRPSRDGAPACDDSSQQFCTSSLPRDRPDHRSEGQKRADDRLDVRGLCVALGDQRGASDGQNLADQCQHCRFQHGFLKFRFHWWPSLSNPLLIKRMASVESVVSGWLFQHNLGQRTGVRAGVWDGGVVPFRAACPVPAAACCLSVPAVSNS